VGYKKEKRSKKYCILQGLRGLSNFADRSKTGENFYANSFILGAISYLKD
jgi:hypothetical protein